MTVAVLIPVYNEESTIETLIEAVIKRREVTEIIAVNDGSVDRSLEILINLAQKDKRIKVVDLKKNSGKGTAIREGLKLVSSDITIIQDADLEYDPGNYPALLAPFVSPGINVVYGSRLKKAWNKSTNILFLLGGIGVTLATNILYGTLLTDEPTGYKVFRSEVLKTINLKSRGFEFCPEITAKVLRQGHQIHEVPITYYPRTVAEGKKIRFRDGITAIFTLLKYRFFQ